ncbi:MAG: VirB4 family type IV secretion/conjugal transfer ATPase [Proteobacteria bacterium]|nr:VirB4 family type IV secretion/conjugal transfer ATPase [Pseudomonadota bacterium]
MRGALRQAALRRERNAAVHIPYSAHVAPGVVRTAAGDYLQAFRLGGASFESADDAQLNAWHERLNVLWRNLASPEVALWTHLIRRPVAATLRGTARGSFAVHLAASYGKRLAQEVLMANELYVALLYRPAPGRAVGLLSRLLERSRPAEARRDLLAGLNASEKLARTLEVSLARYEPEGLRVYARGGRWYSALLEYLALLVNGEMRPVPLPAGPISEALTTTRLMFGNEAIEYRLPTATRVGAVLGIKEYPTPSTVGMYNRLLSAPFPLILAQSFSFVSRAAGQSLLQRQFNRLVNAGDFAVSQAAQLKQALDGLAANEFAIGDHHFTLQVLAEVAADDPDDARRLRPLNDCVAQARSLLADTGMTVAREDLALEAAFWAQLPGNFAMRPRQAPITSRNFAAMAPFHNYPGGRPDGNHWGEALALLSTAARSPYYFSLHASDPSDPEGGSRKDTGHTLICGPTGSGKTVFIGFLVTLLSSQGATQVIFDKDRGLEILVRALGGEYFELRQGLPTGFNPLQLPEGPQHSEFLRGWLQLLVRQGGNAALSARESADLEQALRGTLALEPAARRLSRLIDFLDPTDPEGVHARLSRWCESTQGDYAWVFDNPDDSIAARLDGRAVIGFDVTEFLGHEATRAPLTLYIFHLVRQLLDGRRLVCWMDEFWRLLSDAAFESFAKDGPKTWRKLNGVMCLATQSPSDVLASPISRTIVEQTPTKVFFPSTEAHPQDYIEGLGLSEREFRLIREQLDPGSRTFLVKQGHHSIVCRLDLKGCDAELAVISGRAREVARMHRLQESCGAAVEQWLPPFMAGLDPAPEPTTLT